MRILILSGGDPQTYGICERIEVLLKNNHEYVEIVSNAKGIADYSKSFDALIFANNFLFDYSRATSEKIFNDITCCKIFLSFDDEYMYERTLYFSQFVDAVFTTDIVSFYKFLQIGINAYHWIDPVIAAPVFSEPSFYAYDVSFIGRTDGAKKSRLKYLNPIRENFKSFYAPGLHGEKVDTESMNQAFLNSKINLNLTAISNVNYSRPDRFQSLKTGMKGRPFEIGGQSGFCLSEYSPSLAAKLIDNFDLRYFSTVNECIDLIHELLANDAERVRMSRNLHSKVVLKYSINSKSSELLNQIYNCIKNRKPNNYLAGKKINIFQVELDRMRYKIKKYIRHCNSN